MLWCMIIDQSNHPAEKVFCDSIVIASSVCLEKVTPAYLPVIHVINDVGLFIVILHLTQAVISDDR